MKPSCNSPMGRGAQRAGILAAVLVVLAGCGDQTLYSKLDERRANEMVAVLRLAGIPADKSADETGYAVSAPKDDFARAVQTLQALGLPREDFDSLGKVFKREGFVSTPLEEHSRLIHALSQEISHTVSSIDGVLLARVTLVVPEKHPLSDKIVPSSASVLIKHRPGLDVDTLVPKIKALVVNSVEGLPYESVTVVPFAAEDMSSLAAPERREGGVQTALWLIGGLGLGALGAAGAIAAYRRSVRLGWRSHAPVALRAVSSTPQEPASS
jgi:type III secretion protein J